MIKKNNNTIIRLTIPAGKASPTPPIGPVLAQHKVKIMDFCKEFNNKTANMEKGTLVPVVITVHHDKSFTFVSKSPPVSYLLKKTANIAKGASSPKKDPPVATITRKQCQSIAEIKIKDMNTHSLESAMSTVIACANSLGIEIVE